MFAVPGEITSALSAGTNALLRLGATPLTSAEDVLESSGLDRHRRCADRISATRRQPCSSSIRAGPGGADELARATGLAAGAVAAALTELELAGVVERGGGVYRAAS